MIARMWRGYTRDEDIDDYLEYLQQTGVREYTSTPGNRGCQVLCRRDGQRAEFLLISLWESVDAIRAFAGDEIEQAVFYPEDDRFLVERDLTVSHFDVLNEATGPATIP